MTAQRMTISSRTVRCFCVIGIVLSCALACAAPEDAKRNDAEFLELLVAGALPEGPEGRTVYVSERSLAGGSVISSWGTDVVVPVSFDQAWFYFVDDLPGANWEHSCRYIFVDIESGGYEISSRKTPPDDIDRMRRLFPPE